MCVATPIELDDVYYVLEEVKCGTEGTFPLGFGKILKASLRRSRRRLKQSSFCFINGLPRPHNVIKDVPISEWRVPSAPRNDSFCAKHTLKNLSTYRLNVLKTDNTPTLSRICKFAFSSLTNSTLSQRERVKCAFTLAEVFSPCRKVKLNFGYTLAEVFSPCRKVKLNFGFTLAEVLITLGIIGVVAAVTIPALVNKYQKYVTVNRLKHTYSALSQAVVTSQYENGFITEWDFPADIDIGSADSNNAIEAFANKYLIPYLKVSKILGTKSQYQYYSMSKNLIKMGGYAFTLSDGTLIFLQSENSDGIVMDKMYIKIDINGFTGPNTMGKDIFIIYLNKSVSQTLAFMGTGYSRDYLINDLRGCKFSEHISAGHYCGALIQHDGWQIAPDYPW